MMRAQRGFTLIELLLAVALLGIASVYLFQTFVYSNRAYVVLDQVSESQQNVRAIADLLERDLRHAGMMVPEAAAVCGVDEDDAPDRLYVSDSRAVDPGDDLLPYDGALHQGTFNNVSNGLVWIDVDSLILEPGPPARPAYDTDGDGNNDSDFRVGNAAILVDRLNPDRGTACGRVAAVDLNNTQVRVNVVSGGLTNLVGASQLVLVPAHEYRIGDPPRLLRNGLLLADGVEDLQVAYFFDANGDNVIDAGEVRGDGTGADYVSAGLDVGGLREVRVNLVVRTRAEDRDFPRGQFQELENRTLTGGTPPDGFRRRVHTATVRLRNLGVRIIGA